jgi:hypothetical protein
MAHDDEKNIYITHVFRGNTGNKNQKTIINCTSLVTIFSYLIIIIILSKMKITITNTATHDVTFRNWREVNNKS